MSGSSEDGLFSDKERHTEVLLFDYFKHLTTLALVTLGGVLSISQGAEQVGRYSLLIVVCLVSAGGGVALSALDKITKARLEGQAVPRSIRWYRMIATYCFAMGIGAYIAIFLEIFQ